MKKKQLQGKRYTLAQLREKNLSLGTRRNYVRWVKYDQNILKAPRPVWLSG